MEPKSAAVLKNTWETEGVNLRYIVQGKRGKGKSVVDPDILYAQLTPEQRLSLYEKYKDK